MKALVVVAALLAGCLSSSSNVCGHDMVCPDDQVCVHVTDPDQDLCADPGQLASCIDKARYTRCQTNGRCYDGVCLPIACGNERVDRPDPAISDDVGEVCDDGNERSDDGCAGNCRSDETCGNNVIDSNKHETCDNGNLMSNDGCDSACQPERERWIEIATTPEDRDGAALVFDSVRDRIVRFGGAGRFGSTEPNAPTWEATRTGWQERFPQISPSGAGNSAAYDPVRGRTVVFDGTPGAIWEWNGTSWNNPQPVDGPSTRAGGPMAYDGHRKRVVMYGGTQLDELANSLGDLWAWNGAEWSVMVTTPDSTNDGMGMAYDPVRDVLVIPLQRHETTVAEIDHENHWHLVTSADAGPAPLIGSSMAYDPKTHTTLLVGGSPYITDAWAWNGVAWTALPIPYPLAKYGSAIVTDTRRGEVVMVGYTQGDLAHSSEETMWRWTGTTWTSSGMTAQLPTTAFMSTTYDPVRGVVVGISSAGFAEFDGTSWRKAVGVGGVAPISAAITYDPVDKVAVTFGGRGAESVPTDAMWTWNGAPAMVGAVPRPAARADTIFVWDVARGHAVLFGGTCPDDSCDSVGDTWLWDGENWTPISPGSPYPHARSGAAAAYDPIHEQVVMFGGIADGVARGDTWTWNGTDWTEHVVPGPPARAHAAMAWDANRQRVVLAGGSDDFNLLSDVWEWDGHRWAHTPTDNPSARERLSLSPWAGAGLISFGGFTGSVPLQDTRLLRWDGNGPVEACDSTLDLDLDKAAGCADADCWWACKPLCPPGAPCDPASPQCGNGTCDQLEDCRNCRSDCGTCTPICGDAICDPGETDCPGDCNIH